MPTVEIKNKDVWSDFVTVNTELNDNNQVLTDDTKMNILKLLSGQAEVSIIILVLLI